MKSAVVVVDVQEIMFTHQGGVYNKELILKNIKQVIDKARESQIPVIYIKHYNGKEHWDIEPVISPLNSDPVIIKESWDAFLDTELKDVLISLRIEQLIFVGMQTEFCVDTTIRSAYSHGFKNNILISEGHSTWDTDVISAKEIISHHNSTLGGRFVSLIKSSDITFL